MPEISYSLAVQTRGDVIVATGRSDYPNQINNVIAFPYLFRGALDTRSRAITDEMKMAATHAVAALAREPVTREAGLPAHSGGQELRFGRDYLVPKPFDRRLLPTVASAVAMAAIQSGTARCPVDLEEYRQSLERLRHTM